ncbi:phosphoserine aminotransferase-like protein [Thozetella sp. PMI_491]|nr:phosphoserine aminotransferase-like protein [Thozetella sp. PMI_491]
MPTRPEITYFGAGPALLPTDVLESAAAALLNYNDTGLGIAEHSHRSELATNIINEAKADLARYLDIPAGAYEVLFRQARQKAAVLQELGVVDEKDAEQAVLVEKLRAKVDTELQADYIVTGSWSLKAYQEAVRLLGPEHVNLAVDARTANDGKFGVIPDSATWKLTPNAAFVYYRDNETVDGVEFLKILGSTGVTVAVIKKDLLAPAVKQPEPALMRKLGLPIPPIVLQYETVAKNNSLYNTLSIFDVYVAGQVLKKLLRTYPDKAAGQQAVSDKKATLIYSALESYPEVYKIVPAKSARSRMNICFRVTKNGNIDESEKAFLKEATSGGLTGLKGHRSVGGLRASNYNSIPIEGAEKLASFINDFAKA